MRIYLAIELSLREISYVLYARAYVRALMTQKSCAVGMRNAKLGNHLKPFVYGTYIFNLLQLDQNNALLRYRFALASAKRKSLEFRIQEQKDETQQTILICSANVFNNTSFSLHIYIVRYLFPCNPKHFS